MFIGIILKTEKNSGCDRLQQQAISIYTKLITQEPSKMIVTNN